jgi:hypothetical protein
MKLTPPVPRKLKTTIPGVDQEIFSAPMTLGDLDKINAVKRQFQIDDEQIGACIILTLIHMLVDAAGKKLFNFSDRQTLLDCVPMGAMTDIANEINDSDTGDKKND